MRIFAAIFFCFITSACVAQADFVITSGVYRQNLKYFKSNSKQIETQMSLFFGLGARYQINEKLSINQLVTYHLNENQIPDIYGIDQTQPLHYLNMEFLLNYKAASRLEPSFGFRLGSLFITENFVEPSSSIFVETIGNDIVMMLGLRANLTHNIQFYLKQDLAYLQTQEYLGWFSNTDNGKKNRILYLGLSYAPFKKKTK